MDATEATRRATEFQRTLDPRALWPGVDERRFAAALRAIIRTTSIVLATPDGRSRLTEPEDGDTAALGAAAFASGLGPLLGHWLEVDRLEATPGVAAMLHDHLDHGRRRAARLREALEHLAARFERAHLEVTVLKGMHTGWEYFPEPGTRPVGDIDLLVAPGTVRDAEAVLEAEGFLPIGRVLGRSTWQPPGPRDLRSVTLTHADSAWTIDLHETLDRRFPSAPSPARFGAQEESDRQAWSIGGARAWILAQPLLTCYLAVHAAHHLPHLPTLRLVELVLVLRRDTRSDGAWESLGRRFARTGIGGFGHPVLALAERLVPGTVQPALLDALRAAAPPAVRRLTARITPATALQMYHRTFEGRFLWAGTGWRRVAAIVGWLWPDDGRGGREPPREALAVTVLRVRRFLAGRFRRRVP
jgi:hypothetical protein